MNCVGPIKRPRISVIQNVTRFLVCAANLCSGPRARCRPFRCRPLEGLCLGVPALLAERPGEVVRGVQRHRVPRAENALERR